MAFNIQRRTSDIANVVVADASRNVTLPADLTVTALVSAGLIKANAQGKLVAAVAGTDYGLGTVTSVGLSSATSGVTIGSTPVTTSGTITLTIATASSSQNGLLSSTDWTTFNNKQNALTNPVTGTGTQNYVTKWNNAGGTAIGNSLIYDNGTHVGIGSINPRVKTEITGNLAVPTALSINTAAGNLLLSDDGNIGMVLGLYDASASYAGYIQARNNVGTNNIAYNLFLNPLGGNILLGTTNDSGEKLQVTGSGKFTSSVTAGAFLTNAASGTGGQEGFRINNDNGYIGFFNGANTTRSAYIQGNTTDLTLSTSLATPILFYTSNTEKMRITSGGNLLVGTSVDSGEKLVVNGTSRLIDDVTTFGANGITFLWSGNTISDQRQGRIRPISTPSPFPYAGGLAFDYYSYNGTAYQYYEGLRLNGNGEAIFYGRTTISSGYIADKSGTGNNTGISFGASAIFSTNGSGTSTAKDLGSSASPWGAAYLSSRSFINGAAGYLFDVQENGSNKARLQTYVESNVVSLIAGYDTTAVPFSIYTGGSERFIIDTSGKVAIGSANTNRTGYDANGRTLTLYGPQRSALELGSETPVNSTQLGAVNFLSSTTVKAQIISDLDGSGNANLVFSLAGSSRAVITPNGRLLLGTTTEGSELLQVNGTSRFTGSITIDDTGTAVLSAQGNASTNFFINSRSTLTFQTGGAYGASTTRLTIGSTGAATFSSTLGINGVSDNIKSGEYTPTLTNVGNISSSSLASFKFFYIRIGSYVHVSGAVSITPTVANNGTYLGISLPISSNLGSGDVNGNTNSYIYGYGYVQEDTVNDRAEVFFQPNSTTAGQVWKLNFTYKIV